MINEEYLKWLLSGTPLINNGDFVPVELTELMWNADQKILLSIFERKNKDTKEVPVFHLELKCPVCGEKFILTVSSATSVYNVFHHRWGNTYVFDEKDIPRYIDNSFVFREYETANLSSRYDQNNHTITLTEYANPLCRGCAEKHREEILQKVSHRCNDIYFYN